jgi:hypothetical protein
LFPGAGQVAVADVAVIGIDEPDARIVLICFDQPYRATKTRPGSLTQN